MLLLNKQGLGEQALNKIAEIALASQFNRSENLRVQIKTEPSLLAQGKLASLSIDGLGLVVKENLRMEAMQLKMNEITVNPFKALMGNIELSEPIKGTACIVLTETDFNKAFKCDSLIDRLHYHGLSLLKVNCHFHPTGEISVMGEGREEKTHKRKKFTLTVRPQALCKERGVILEDISGTEGEALREDCKEILLGKVKEILNLRNFEMKGLSLSIEDIKLENKKLVLKATALMTAFPGR